MSRSTTRLERGEATSQDIDLLLDISDSILGRSFCGLGDVH
ncbi:MAG: NADH-ubiquinone oxidoreductase-F iron-sulfur binding region domain-containing protein [Mycobacteriales bacterium]